MPFYLHMGKQIIPKHPNLWSSFCVQTLGLCGTELQCGWPGMIRSYGRGRYQPAHPLPDTRLDAPRFHFSLHDQSHLELQDGETHRKKKKKKRKIGLGIFRAFSFLKKLSTQNKSSQERSRHLKAEFDGTGEMVQQLGPKFCFQYPHQADSNGPSLYLQGIWHLLVTSEPGVLCKISLILHFTSSSSLSDPNSLGNSEE